MQSFLQLTFIESFHRNMQLVQSAYYVNLNEPALNNTKSTIELLKIKPDFNFNHSFPKKTFVHNTALFNSTNNTVMQDTVFENMKKNILPTVIQHLPLKSKSTAAQYFLLKFYICLKLKQNKRTKDFFFQRLGIKYQQASKRKNSELYIKHHSLRQCELAGTVKRQQTKLSAVNIQHLQACLKEEISM